MSNQIYNSFKRDSMAGVFNLSADTIKIALVTSSYICDIDNHTKYSDITDEVIGYGYTTSGATLAGVVILTDLTNDKSILDANDVTWPSSTITAAGGVLYKVNSTAESSPLIGYIDFGGNKSSLNGDFVIQWNSSGILTLG